MKDDSSTAATVTRRFGKGPVLAVIAVAVLLVLGTLALARGSQPEHPVSAPPASGPYALVVHHEQGLQIAPRATDAALEVATPSGYADRFWAGVNLGSTTPGAQPGELRQSRGDYNRWLDGMGKLGATVVRIYTILPPAFYEALAAYNDRHASAPIRFIQGIWIPEDEFMASHDLFAPAVVNGFRQEIARMVGVVHGDATIPAARGHASGVYRTDVSAWLLAWSPGIEWDPFATRDSDRKNVGRAPYHGTYITTRSKPTPTESWIASMLDYLAGLEHERGWTRPLTFTNWLTTDPLAHPEEPLPQEDWVSIDAMHLAATAKWPGGFFASYHAYPYYPEFLSLAPEYATYRVDGKVDPYAGYLHTLRAHHAGQAVMITEFGVPTGLGVAHRGPLGRDQGDHSEREGLQIDGDLLQAIHDEGFTGGILFEWADEWFKHTWNTQDYELPRDRSQLWRNVYTNEENFGVVSSDSGITSSLTIDGDPRDWTGKTSTEIYATHTGVVREVRARHDEAYLALKLTTADATPWRKERIVLGFDVAPGSNKGLPYTNGSMPSADIAVVIGPGDRAEVLRAAWFDSVSAQYGDDGGLGMLQTDAAEMRKGSGAWYRPTLMLNRAFVDPDSKVLHPTQTADISELSWGKSDPVAGGDSHNLVSGAATTLELRIPWMQLGYADPSSHTVLIPRGQTFDTTTTRQLAIGVSAGDAHYKTRGYSWDQWDRVQYHERFKAGFDELRVRVKQLAQSGTRVVRIQR